MLRIYAIMAGAVLVAAVSGIWLATFYLDPEGDYAPAAPPAENRASGD